MNCSIAQQVLTECTDAESALELAAHLDTCRECREEEQIQRRIGASLRSVTREEQAAWGRARASVGRRRFGRRIGLAAAAALALAYGTLTLLTPTIDLPREMTANHRKYLSGQLPPQVQSGDADRLSRFFEPNFDFPTLAGDPGEGVELLGARTCALGPAPCAYFMARVDGTDISLFVLDSSLLPDVPDLSVRRAEFSTVIFTDGARIICAIASLPPDRLEHTARRLTLP